MTKTKLLPLTLWWASCLMGGSQVLAGSPMLQTWGVADSMRVVKAEQLESRTRLDFFAGVDFNYRDITHNKLYEILINLTPGVKWYMGHRWQFAAQGIIPVYNDFGARYRRVRLNMAVISKEWDWRRRFFLKASGGLFGNECYGLDLKAGYIAARWLAFDVQAGCTGYCSMATGWECGDMKRVTGQVRARFYIPPAQTEIDLSGGRYLYSDYAVKCEAMRHFRHCTVGVYAQYSDLGKDNYGFKVVMMIPPYRRRNSKVRVRPASAFRLTYNQNADAYSLRNYTTDPEENEREGWFDRSRFEWGANTQQPDFRLHEGKRRIGHGKEARSAADNSISTMTLPVSVTEKAANDVTKGGRQ